MPGDSFDEFRIARIDAGGRNIRDGAAGSGGTRSGKGALSRPDAAGDQNDHALRATGEQTNSLLLFCAA